jgi:low affinity Fe/Cu permease
MVREPIAFTVVIGYAIAWLILEHKSFDWHAVATLATWLMTLVITRAEHRDTQALHAKLDELLRSDSGSRSELAGLDDKEPEDIERHRAHARADDVAVRA